METGLSWVILVSAKCIHIMLHNVGVLISWNITVTIIIEWCMSKLINMYMVLNIIIHLLNWSYIS